MGESKINESVSIAHQRSPCLHTISEFEEYQRRVVENSKYFVSALQDIGYDIVSNGTDNHLALINLHRKKIGGAQVETVCEAINIALNKNTVPGDKSAMNPGGIRVGTPAMTTRGCSMNDFEQIASFIHGAVELALDIQNECGSAKLKDFKAQIA